MQKDTYLEYQQLVIEYYEQKKAANKLPHGLLHPTPANLKKECVKICLSRFERRDEKILAAFFGECVDAKAYAKVIDRFDTDKFRPLLNFLKKKTNKPDSRIIELLAWLIDFEQRPWELGKKWKELDAEMEVGEIAKPVIKEKQEQKKELNQPAKKKNAKRAWLITAGIIIISVLAYMAARKEEPVFSMNGPAGCMYWKDDHYEQIACNQKPGNDLLVIALDTEKLRHFKKITQPDTISFAHKGKVWYSKRNNQLEFYTTPGKHPLNPNLELRPITDHIIRTYLLNKAVIGK